MKALQKAGVHAGIRLKITVLDPDRLLETSAEFLTFLNLGRHHDPRETSPTSTERALPRGFFAQDHSVLEATPGTIYVSPIGV